MRCCVCKSQVEEREVGLQFESFDDDRTPLYRKLYAYWCKKCNSFRQVEREFKVGEYEYVKFRKAIKVRKSMED